MTRRFFLLFATLSAATAADLPPGEALMNRALGRTGSPVALARVKTAVMTGTVEMLGHNIMGSVAVYQEGEKNYTVIEFPGIGKAEEGFDGETAWERNALQGARVKDGDERAAAIRNARIFPLSNWRAYYTSARTVASEDVDGKPAWKVELTPKVGKPEAFYFNKQSGLPVRMTETVTTALGDIPVDAALSDYRVVDGIQTPFTLTQKAMSQTLVMRFEKVTYNAPIPEGRFDPPADVKALAAKRAVTKH